MSGDADLQAEERRGAEPAHDRLVVVEVAVGRTEPGRRAHVGPGVARAAAGVDRRDAGIVQALEAVDEVDLVVELPAAGAERTEEADARLAQDDGDEDLVDERAGRQVLERRVVDEVVVAERIEMMPARKLMYGEIQ